MWSLDELHMRCLDRPSSLFFFFPTVLHNCLFPVIFYLFPLKDKVKYHQSKAEQQPTAGQEPRESSIYSSFPAARLEIIAI